ncbi:hypothetical protein C8F04DRAFT_950821 [Mycena alexandri]|uniref:Uncharacterized protein n=1 Tax=Mycena alexandri TaxID=1745969 RepID=A0AAD6X8G9_9AGAR|nr:hypothetical protein C8F04DRAFT_950821 [Mycena alexandri]
MRSSVYQFFKSPTLLEDGDGRQYQYFKCAAPKSCKAAAKGISRYQTNKDGSKAADRSSTSNLMKHAKKCWGADVVKARMQGVEAQAKDGSIFSAFARAKDRPVAPSNHTLTEAELRCASFSLFINYAEILTNTVTRAHIVRWIAENNRPLSIVEDREFKYILGAGRPEFRLPGRRTVARDLHAAYQHSRSYVQTLLEEYPGRLSFSTDAWTSPNHRAFVAWIVHLQHEGELLSFPLDVYEVPEV